MFKAKVDKPKNTSPTLALMIASLNKEYPRAIRSVVDPTSVRKIQTGVFQIDRILGGGLPKNRLNLICGQKAAFKTTLALKALANFLVENEGECVYIDTEHALDESLVHRILGSNANRVQLFRPEYGELACEYAERFAKLPEVGAVVIDSLADLNGKAALDKGYFDSLSRGIRALLITRMTRAMVSLVDVAQPKLVIMVNHLLPFVDGHTVGEYTPGGKTQIMNSSVVIKVWTMSEGKEENRRTFEDIDALDTPVRQKHIGFLIQHSKVSHDNVSGEYSLFLEDSEKNAIHYGDANEQELVLTYHQMLGLTEDAPPFTLYGKKFPSRIALIRHWRSDAMFYLKVKADLIEKLKHRQGGQR